MIILRTYSARDSDNSMNKTSTHKINLMAVCLLSAALNGAGYAATATAADSSAIPDPEVRACVDRALPRHAVRQKVALQVAEATATMRESSGTLLWKRFDDGLAKVMFRIEDSPQYQGVAVLLIERKAGEPEVYMYSPELRRDRRITSAALAGPLLGTDFSYEDFALVQHLGATGEMQRLADGDVDGQPAFVVETRPDEESSSYSRVLTFIDKTWCLPLLTQFFAHNGSLYKELVVDRAEVRQQERLWVPMRSTMHDHKRHSRTVLSISNIEIDPELPDDLFTPAALRKVH